MATQLKKLWKFATTYDLLKLGKPVDAVETGAEVSKAVLEFAIAMDLLAAVPAAPIAAAELSFVGIARKGVKLYREKTNKERSHLLSLISKASMNWCKLIPYCSKSVQRLSLNPSNSRSKSWESFNSMSIWLGTPSPASMNRN
jgi:hypothetical protein